MLDQQDSELSLQLIAPADAPIGLYRLSMEASTGYQGSSFMLGHFTLLFNPWCPGEVYSTHGQVGGGQGQTHPRELLRVEMGQKRHQDGLSEAHPVPLRAQLPQPCDVRTPLIPMCRGGDRLTEAR